MSISSINNAFVQETAIGNDSIQFHCNNRETLKKKNQCKGTDCMQKQTQVKAEED